MKMSNQIKSILIEYIKKHGMEMIKKISSGGLFSSPTYDERTCYSLDDIYKLIKEGFQVSENTGHLVFNAIITSKDENE